MRKFYGKMYVKSSLCTIIAVICLLLSSSSVIAETTDSSLASRYSPIFYFEGEETCYPVDVSYCLDNSLVYIYGITPEGQGEPANNLSAYSGSFDNAGYVYLDNTMGTINDTGVIDDYQQSGLGYTVYARVLESEGKTIIQYWMFYAFNPGEINQHEGDWEMVQVVLTAGNPSNVMYSQHESGQIATWDQVEKDGDNIKVYVSRGSHANYLRPYSGRLTSDFVGTNGEILNPIDYTIVMLEDQDWLNYPGRWGEINSEIDIQLGRAGPYGPKFRENGYMWNNPVSWGSGLQGANEQMFLFEWFLYNFVTIFILLSLLCIGLIAFRIYRRHKKYGLGPRIVSIFYIDGPNMKSIGNIICIVGVIIVIYALFQPWWGVTYQISGNTAFEPFATDGMIELIKVDGTTGIQMIPPPFMGSLAVTSFYMPFSLFIAIGLVFFILATIGIHKSSKLGGKYIFRGIRVMIPIILLIIILVVMGSIITSMVPDVGDETISNSIVDVLGDIFGKPLSGESTLPIIQEDVTGQLDLNWGLGNGGWFLIFGGIVLIIAGALEIAARTTFFKPKLVERSEKQKKQKPGKIDEEEFKKSDEIKGLKLDVKQEDEFEEETK